MFVVSLVPVVLIGIAVAVIVGRRSNRAETPGVAPSAEKPNVADVGRGRDRAPAALGDALARWVAAGLITTEQASAISDHERTVAEPARQGRERPPHRPRRVPAFAEALGYLGGVLALAGLGVLIGNAWPDLATPVRLALSFAVTVAVIGGGAVVSEQLDPALARLRWFLWTIAAGTSALFTAVLMTDVWDVEGDQYVASACFGAAALVSAVLWWGRDRPVQELLSFAGTIVAAGLLVSAWVNSGVGGLVVWFLAAGTLAVGLRGLTPEPFIAHIVGAIAVVAGSAVTIQQWAGAGMIFALSTAGGLLLLGALPRLHLDGARRMSLFIVGGIGAFQITPGTIGYFASDAGAATGLVTWTVGIGLLALGTRRMLRAPIVAEIVGGLAMIGGAALTGTQWPGFAPLFGLATALCFVLVGMLPGRVLYSVLGSLGLLINVPWAIGRFFPGEGRAPLLILVSGVLIIVVAVLLARQGTRLRTELTLSGKADDGADESRLTTSR